MSTSTKHSRTARAVVPVARRIKLRRVPLKTYQQFFDQQPVVKDDGAGSAGQCQLLVGEIRVGERSQTRGIAPPKNSSQFIPGCLHPSRDDQSGIAEVNESDFAPLVDAPTVSEVGRQAGLTAVRNPGIC